MCTFFRKHSRQGSPTEKVHCHSIYPFSDYSLKSLKESPSCTYKKKHNTCKELLFRKVKLGSNYKLMPKRIYVYIPLKRVF